MLRTVEEGPETNVEDNVGRNEMPDCGCMMWTNFTPRTVWKQFYIINSSFILNHIFLQD